MRLSISMLATVLTTVASVPVLAQTERTSSVLREDCKHMTEAMRTGPTHAGYEDARSLIERCDVTGGPALADRWTRVTGEDPSDLAQLRGRTREFRDRDLLLRVIELVQDPTRAPDVRIALIDVLVSYYAPGRSLSPAAMETDPKYCLLGGLSHYRSTESANPIRPEDRPLMMLAIEVVAMADGDDRVRRVAGCALNGMRLVG